MRFDTAVFESAAGTADQLPQSDLPEVVFSGRSNVGKSSLINKLVNRKALARVSATPGKTGTINFYRLQELRLVDLPGYGYAKVSFHEKQRWAQLVEGYFGARRNILLTVQIVDMRHPPTVDDMHMISYLREYGRPFIIVLTKSDKLNKQQRADRMAGLRHELHEFEGVKLIPFSSVAGEGLDDIRRIVSDCLQEQCGSEGMRF